MLIKKRKRVVIDARLAGGKGGGFSRYEQNLIHGLRQTLHSSQSDVGLEVILLRNSGEGSAIEGFEVAQIQSSFLSPKEWWEIPRILNQLDADLYHSPTFSSVPPFLMPCPWVITVHDLNHLSFGSVTKKLYYRTLLKRFVQNASAVLTVSEFSRSELSSWLNVPIERIGLAWNALDPAWGLQRDFEAIAKKREITPGQYFLCVSNDKPHKNVRTLINAYRTYSERFGELAIPLVLSTCGLGSQISGVREMGYIQESELEPLLAHARSIFFPSIYEGFGLPPVEAASLGVPVFASLIPPHREGLFALQETKGVHWIESAREEAEWIRAFELAHDQRIAGATLEQQALLRDRFSTERLGRDTVATYIKVLEGEQH